MSVWQTTREHAEYMAEVANFQLEEAKKRAADSRDSENEKADNAALPGTVHA